MSYSDDDSSSYEERSRSVASDGTSEEIFREDMRVFLRLRPMNKLEQSRRSKNCIELHEDPTVITVDSPLEGEYDFSFDHVFEEYASQDEVYEQAVNELVPRKVVEGYNCFVIAYGQTSSGKTHTMLGPEGARTKSIRMDSQRSIGNGTLFSTDVTGGDRDETTTIVTEYTSSSSGFPSSRMPVLENNRDEGMIPRTVKSLFEEIKNAKGGREYTVRCSYVEIYLEKILDLLHPQGTCSLVEEDEGYDDELGRKSVPNVKILGASELCCLNAGDVGALLARGNACRTMSSTEMNTDSSRSHAVFILKLFQRDPLTDRIVKSSLHMCDLAGSELGNAQANQMKRGSQTGKMGANSAMQIEATMINKSLAALQRLVRARLEIQNRPDSVMSSLMRPQQSKLAQLLQPAFGGNCMTTMILTASPSSYNIGETISTIRFGQRVRRIENKPKMNEDEPPRVYRKRVRKIEKDLKGSRQLLFKLATEFASAQEKGTEADEKLDDLIDEILRQKNDEGGLTQFRVKIIPEDPADDTTATGSTIQDIDEANQRILQLEKERELLEISRTNSEAKLAELQSEVAVLRTQNENLTADKTRSLQELIDAKNEIQMLSQRKLEVEHNLRTSQFRENEAIVFLRQFRRFYRNVLKDKAAHGSGSINQITGEVAEKVANAPDLTELRDIDILLLESGLIEDHELGEDRSSANYKPSKEALLRSAGQAQRLPNGDESKLDDVHEMAENENAAGMLGTEAFSPQQRNGEKDGNVDRGLASATELSTSRYAHSISRGPRAGLVVTRRQKVFQTPSGRLSIERERHVEEELLDFAEKCIKLEEDLASERATVDALTNKAGGLSKKRLAQEAIQLRQQLDKKTASLTAIAWKMNELNLINKTYNEKMVNREQHVLYLEETLVDLQNTNRRLLVDRQETEKKLRDDMEQLQKIVDGMTIPLWQFGESKIDAIPVDSRIVVPILGNEEESDLKLERRMSTGEDEDDYHSQQNVGEVSEEQARGEQPAIEVTDAAIQTDLEPEKETSEIEIQTDPEPIVEMSEVDVQTETVEHDEREIQTDPVEFKADVELVDAGTMTDSFEEPLANGRSNSQYSRAEVYAKDFSGKIRDDRKSEESPAEEDYEIDQNPGYAKKYDAMMEESRGEDSADNSRRSNRMFGSIPPLSENRAQANSEIGSQMSLDDGVGLNDFDYDDLGKKWGLSDSEIAEDAAILTPTKRSPAGHSSNKLLGQSEDEMSDADESVEKMLASNDKDVVKDGGNQEEDVEPPPRITPKHAWRIELDASERSAKKSEVSYDDDEDDDDTYEENEIDNDELYGSRTSKGFISDENTKGDDDFEAMMTETAAALRAAAELLPSDDGMSMDMDMDDASGDGRPKLDDIEQDDSMVSLQKYEENSSEDDTYVSIDDNEKADWRQEMARKRREADSEVEEATSGSLRFEGGKALDYKPVRFGSKRGQTVKAAVMKEGKKSLLPEYDDASTIAPESIPITRDTIAAMDDSAPAQARRHETESSRYRSSADDRHHRSASRHHSSGDDRRRKKKSSTDKHRSSSRNVEDDTNESSPQDRKSSRHHSSRKKKSSSRPRGETSDAARKSSSRRKKSSGRDEDRPRRTRTDR